MALIPVLVFSFLILIVVAALMPTYVNAMAQFSFSDPSVEFLFKIFAVAATAIVLIGIVLALANYIPSVSGGGNKG